MINTEVQLENLPYRMVGSESDKSVFGEIVKYKIWEPHVSQIISNTLKKGDIFVDVGSNIGYFLLLGSYLVGSSGKVIGFEPVPINYYYCQKNIKLNKITNVEVYPFALWDDAEKKKIVIPNEFFGNSQIQYYGEFEVDCLTLDSLDIKPNLIKIDIEGAEPFQLYGMKDTVSKYNPTVIIEMNRLALRNGFGLDADVYWDFFENYGYSISLINPDASLRPVKSLDELNSICSPELYVDLFCRKDTEEDIMLGNNIPRRGTSTMDIRDLIKTNDEDVEVEDLIRKIRNRVNKRRGINYTEQDINATSSNSSSELEISSSEIQKDLDIMNSNQNIYNSNYIISSHRPFIGKILVRGRRLVNGEIRRYVDPTFSKQIQYNSSLAGIVNQLIIRSDECASKYDNLETELLSMEMDISQDVLKQQQQTKEEILRQQQQTKAEISNKLVQARAKVHEEILRQQQQIKAEIDNQLIRSQTEMQHKIRTEIDDKLVQAKTELVEEIDRIIEVKALDNDKISKTPWSKHYNKKVSEDYLIKNIDYHEHLINLIKEYAQMAASGAVPKLLEVGLGTATMSIYFSRYSYEVVGVDNDPMVILNAARTNESLGGYAKFILMDAFDLDMFKHKYFDVAFSQGTMEHFDDKDIIDLISNQLEVAKFVIFSVPSIDYPGCEFGNERKMTTKDWENILQNGEFNMVDINYYKDDQHIVCIIQ